MGLCTLAEAKLQLGKTTTADDVEIQSYIDAVTAPVEDYCGAVVAATVTNERHDPVGAVLVLRSERVASVTSLTEYRGTTAQAYTQITTPASAGIYTYTLEGIVVRRLGSSGYEAAFGGPVYVTYTAGFAAVPTELNVAARIIVQTLWRTQNGGAGLPQLSDEPMEDVEGFEAPIPLRAKMLLDKYQRTSGFA